MKTETGQLVPFLELEKLFQHYNSTNCPHKMDLCYANQATSLPHFSGHFRQRGSSFGDLAAGIGRVALPVARRFILPTRSVSVKNSWNKVFQRFWM